MALLNRWSVAIDFSRTGFEHLVEKVKKPILRHAALSHLFKRVVKIYCSSSVYVYGHCLKEQRRVNILNTWELSRN